MIIEIIGLFTRFFFNSSKIFVNIHYEEEYIFSNKPSKINREKKKIMVISKYKNIPISNNPSPSEVLELVNRFKYIDF